MTDKPKRPHDANQLAKFIVDVATGEEPLPEAKLKKSQSDFGKEGGKIGGVRRATSLSPERRKEIAEAAARARWSTDE